MPRTTITAPDSPDSTADLPSLIRTLRTSATSGERVLSAYLDTTPRRVNGQVYLLSFRDAVRELRSTLPGEELAAFSAAAEQAERFLAADFIPAKPGLAIFTSGGTDLFHMAALPASPPEGVHWGKRAEIGPLQAMLDEYERLAVLLFDKQRARLFTVYLGEIEREDEFTDEVPGKQATGGWFALAQSRYARHHEDHVLRHARRAIALLTSTLHTTPFDRLLIGGPNEAVTLLRQHLPRPLRDRLAGTLRLELFADEQQVLRASLAAAEEIERRFELELVMELLEAVSTRHGVLGVDPTLAALGEGRVHVLYVAEPLPALGRQCQVCGGLTAGEEQCSACGGSFGPLEDLAELAIQQALAQGARIEVVRGVAADTLREHGGLGTLTRY